MYHIFMDVSKELVAASSRPLVLSILREGENYGYAIIQRVKELSGGRLEWTEGMLYPVLHRLEREGLLKSQTRAPTRAAPGKYYRLERPRAARRRRPNAPSGSRCIKH